MGDGNTEVSVLDKEQEVSASLVRQDLASQLDNHIVPEYSRIGQILKETKNSGQSEVIFVNYDNGIDVSLADPDTRAQYLNVVSGKTRELVRSSRLLVHHIDPSSHEPMTVGYRLLRKKIDRNKTLGLRSRLSGLRATQDDAEMIIKDVLLSRNGDDSPKTVIARLGGKAHDTVDVFNSQGWGLRIRIISGEWILNGISDSLHYVRPENLRGKDL